MKYVLILVLSLFSTGAFAQHENEHHATDHGEAHSEHKEFKHSIAVMLGHSHIDEGRNTEGDPEWITVASFAVDYNYHFNHKWSVGLHNDILLETFVIERYFNVGLEEEFLEREYPIASVAVVGYRVFPFLIASAGFGGEFAPGENFAMIRIGVEAGFHLKDPSWELVTGINYDARIDAYDIWNLTAGVAKRF
ncbi:hypothetical protein [Robertkochia sediminum]|uniref:hypothetical protein n=1 Tax=Robertkochia sediminum TaxID=2785326 RepID=UPI00193357EF|nr:hypothetical protein [Robertkochia sediminum]MBL7472678.1 hypothetical protein [Robertkochia sediminum]